MLTKEHPTLNTSKGVIRCPDIEFMTEAEIIEGLSEQRVVEVNILKRKEDNELKNTRTAIITFNSGKIPRMVDFGLYPVKVELYISRPMRCITCMRLGHTKKRCKNEKTCADCSLPVHETSCKETKCVLCRACPVFLDEVEINKIKTENRITYGEAKHIRRRQCLCRLHAHLEQTR